MARSLAGPVQGGRRPGLEGGGPKTGKVATNPGVGSVPNLGTTRSWSNAARKLEKRGSRQRPAAADDWKKSVFKYHKYCVEDGLSVDTPECRSGVSFLPAPADPPPTPTRRPTGCPADADPPSHWLPRRSPPPPGATGLDWLLPPVSSSRRTLGSSSPPTPTRRPTGCPVGRRRLCRLPRRSLLPAGLSGVPPRRRRPVASRGCRSRLVAPPSGRSFPPDSREFLPADADPPPPGATGFDWLPRRSPPPQPVAAPAAPSRRPLGSSSPPPPTRRPTGCPVGRRRLCRLLRRSLLPAGHSH